MKKVMAVVIAVLVAVSALATFVPAGAAYTPVGENILPNIGDPDYVDENSVNLNCGEWVYHCEWRSDVIGWLGYNGGYDSQPGTTTREIVTTTLSDGSEGKAFHLIDNQDYSTFFEFGIENVDILCGGFEEGKTYVAKVTAKAVAGDKPYVIEWNGYSKTEIPVDNTWHTYYVYYTYTSTDATSATTRTHSNWNGTQWKDTYGVCLCLCENGWMSAGSEIYYEGVEIYEAESDGNLIVDPCFDADLSNYSGWSDNCEWVADSHTSDGTGSYKSVKIGHFGQTDIALEPGTYTISGWVKCSADFSMGTSGFNGIGFGLEPAPGSQQWGSYGFAGIVNSNDDLPTEWTYYETTFTVETAGTYRFSCVNWGPASGTVQFDELYLGLSESPYKPVPTGDTGILAVAVVAVALLATVVFTKKKITDR